MPISTRSPRIVREIKTTRDLSRRTKFYDFDVPRSVWIYRGTKLGESRSYYFTRCSVDPETYADGFKLEVIAGFFNGEEIALPINF